MGQHYKKLTLFFNILLSGLLILTLVSATSITDTTSTFTGNINATGYNITADTYVGSGAQLTGVASLSSANTLQSSLTLNDYIYFPGTVNNGLIFQNNSDADAYIIRTSGSGARTFLLEKADGTDLLSYGSQFQAYDDLGMNYNEVQLASQITLGTQVVGARASTTWVNESGVRYARITGHTLDDAASNQTHIQVYTTDASGTMQSRWDIDADTDTPTSEYVNTRLLLNLVDGSSRNALKIISNGTVPPVRIYQNETGQLCDVNQEGGIYYDGTNKNLYLCDGTNRIDLTVGGDGNFANLSDWFLQGNVLSFNGSGTPVIDTTAASNEIQIAKRVNHLNNTLKDILLDVQDNQSCTANGVNLTGKVWQSSEDNGRINICNPGIGGNGIDRVAFMRDIPLSTTVSYGTTVSGSETSLFVGGNLGMAISNSNVNGESSFFVNQDGTGDNGGIQLFAVGSNNSGFPTGASSSVILADSESIGVLGNSLGDLAFNRGDGAGNFNETNQVVIGQGNVTINRPLVIGLGTAQTNITMTSPNGAEWNCGVTNAGAFECN